MKNTINILLMLIIMLTGVFSNAQDTTPVNLDPVVKLVKKFAKGYGAVAKDDFYNVNMRAYISKDRILILDGSRHGGKLYELIEIKSHLDGIDTVYTALFINQQSLQKKKLRVEIALGENMLVVYFSDAEYYFKF